MIFNNITAFGRTDVLNVFILGSVTVGLSSLHRATNSGFATIEMGKFVPATNFTNLSVTLLYFTLDPENIFH